MLQLSKKSCMHILTTKTEAIEFAESQRKLADFLEITRQSITTWGDTLPQSSAQKLYILTNGKVGKQIHATSKNSKKVEVK